MAGGVPTNFTLGPSIVPPPCITRRTHTVRIKSKNGRFFADVEILDAFSLMLPNNQQIAFRLQPISPIIVDDTGDGNGKDGGPAASRKSHMQRVTSKTDPGAFFDIEVCDAFVVVGPNHSEFAIHCPGPGQYPFDASAKGSLDPSNFQGSASDDGFVAYVPTIIDNSGAGLSVEATTSSTRAQHVMPLARQVTNGNSGTVGSGEIASTNDYTMVLLTDAIVFQGPEETQGMPWQVQIDFGNPGDVRQFADPNMQLWYQEHVMFAPNLADLSNGALFPSTNTVDTTQYVVDPLTNQLVPPPPGPGDLNVFVYFPDNMSSPFLGAGLAIDTGPIWWIRQLGTTPNVWFWYLSPRQTPKAFSFFGIPPEGVVNKWGYRGFQYLSTFPVSYIQSVNFPMVPMGDYGTDDLQTAAIGHGTLQNPGPVNWYGYGMCTGPFPVSTTKTLGNSEIAGLPQSIIYTVDDQFYPFGAFDLQAPKSSDILAFAERFLPGSVTFYNQHAGPTPNIWELTGLEQPPLKNPNLPWDPNTNGYTEPTVTLAQQVVQLFAANWNAVATGINAEAAASNGSLVAVAGYPFIPPPNWNWKRPYGGDSVPTALMFSNGWIPEVGQINSIPCYVPTIAVDQLDPTVWDVQQVIDTGGPPPTWAFEGKK